MRTLHTFGTSFQRYVLLLSNADNAIFGLENLRLGGRIFSCYLLIAECQLQKLYFVHISVCPLVGLSVRLPAIGSDSENITAISYLKTTSINFTTLSTVCTKNDLKRADFAPLRTTVPHRFRRSSVHRLLYKYLSTIVVFITNSAFVLLLLFFLLQSLSILYQISD